MNMTETAPAEPAAIVRPGPAQPAHLDVLDLGRLGIIPPIPADDLHHGLLLPEELMVQRRLPEQGGVFLEPDLLPPDVAELLLAREVDDDGDLLGDGVVQQVHIVPGAGNVETGVAGLQSPGLAPRTPPAASR
ncbi:hypothetical protein KC361_g36 [Hortaea werneckii]|nr:hypothetical protein KC361_g36 [Hortaea werneckii]